MMLECIEGDEREARIGQERLEQRREKVKEQEARETYTDCILHGLIGHNLSRDSTRLV
jgi:hypothetical protein